jgi:hypothetical protein
MYPIQELHTEIIMLNGTTAVNTVNTNIFRINNMGVIAAGVSAGGESTAVGNITLQDTGASIIYNYIIAGFTRTRNSHYTVPINKVLIVTHTSVSCGFVNNSNEYARMIVKGACDPTTGFKTGAGGLRYE